LVGADRDWLEREETEVLAEIGVAKVTTHILTDIDRGVTQRMAGVMYDGGVAGVRYRSNVGEGACVALFESRARFLALGQALAVTPEMDEARTLPQSEILFSFTTRATTTPTRSRDAESPRPDLR
jgi:hypothetical protein